MLTAKGITKSYGNLQILKGIDLNVAEREVVAIVGASGAGKTTLLQILSTLEKPDSGELLINNTPPFSLSSKKLAAFRNENIGFIYQFHQLLPEFTAIENIALPALIKGEQLKSARNKAAELLKKLGLTDRAEHKPNELSGGEQQRVAVARALINSPKIVFADEPSGNLDSKNSKELHELFFQLRDDLGHTFVIVTHNEELAAMTDRTIHIADGSLVH
ncbi:MAG: ABC transporter ATP-binding protein [Bacteroidetes bacterium]|nr:MAG: ABC transporter ATP-binding protein [Bacteroidota bacterium]